MNKRDQDVKVEIKSIKITQTECNWDMKNLEILMKLRCNHHWKNKGGERQNLWHLIHGRRNGSKNVN